MLVFYFCSDIPTAACFLLVQHMFAGFSLQTFNGTLWNFTKSRDFCFTESAQLLQPSWGPSEWATSSITPLIGVEITPPIYKAAHRGDSSIHDYIVSLKMKRVVHLKVTRFEKENYRNQTSMFGFNMLIFHCTVF